MSSDSFQCKSTFSSGDKSYSFYDINKLSKTHDIHRLPFSLKILLENLLRKEDGLVVTEADIEALLSWSPSISSDNEIAFTPARVILQDFTGVPAVVDLAAMRSAMPRLKGDPSRINPLSPVELVIDHSVMVDDFGNPLSFQRNVEMEFARNEERYCFLRWGQTAFQNFRVVPPGTGIVHQVNLEYLARVIFEDKIETGAGEEWQAYPDTLVGTDSHTTMINGLGVLGWGVGGIEAEAAMLGQPITMLIPDVIGFKLSGKLPEGTTATDLVLTVVEMLRKKNVVGKFVEFYGDGLDHLPVADRATIANMAPEYGATCGMFPIDEETLKFLKLSGRTESQIELVKNYAMAQGMFRTTGCREAEYSDILTLNLDTVLPCIAGPKRPQDRILLSKNKEHFQGIAEQQGLSLQRPREKERGDLHNLTDLTHGSVVIAAITSCTNTSNPEVMIAAGLLAKKALELGIRPKPWVKTSLAPGSQVVTDYLEKADLMKPLDALGFNLVGYGCTTCIGNSGPLPEPVSEAIKANQLSVAAVLSGNRNFEGRIHPEVRFAYLASPPLVVAFALAGTMNIDFYKDPIGFNADSKPVTLKDLWPSRHEVQQTIQQFVHGNMYKERYRSVFEGDEQWKQLQIPTGELFQWDENSTYVKNPPFFADIQETPPPLQDIHEARVLAYLGDSVTTDHISPAGNIAKNSPAGLYLNSLGVNPKDFNSYGSRRGNHEVMMRGTFANIRLKNLLLPGSEGNITLHIPTMNEMSIYDAAMAYQKEHCPLIILAGQEYGTGSSRDWAAKGTYLLGIRAVIAESFERIHRSNLIGMGVLPLEFMKGQSAKILNLTGFETYSLSLKSLEHKSTLNVLAKDKKSGESKTFQVQVRIDTPKELEYYQHGGILHYVLRQLARKVA